MFSLNNRFRMLLLLHLLLFGGFALCQGTYFQGKVDGQLFGLALNLDSGSELTDSQTLAGTGMNYFYGSKFLAQGTISDGNLALEVRNDEKRLGELEGSLNAAFQFIGTWISVNSDEHVPVAMQPIAIVTPEIHQWEHASLSCQPLTFLPAQTSYITVNEKIRERLSALTSRYEADADAVHANDATLSGPGWECNVSSHLQWHSGSLISVLFTRTEFTGGAHANVHYSTLNLRVANDSVEEIEIDDIFDSRTAYLTALMQYCVSELTVVGAGDVRPDYLHKNASELLQRFSFQKDGILFYFPPYTVGAFAEGVYEVFVPFTAITPFLAADLSRRIFSREE